MFGLKWRRPWFFSSKWRPARGRSSWRSAKIETVCHRGHVSQMWCFWKNLNQKSLRSLTSRGIYKKKNPCHRRFVDTRTYSFHYSTSVNVISILMQTVGFWNSHQDSHLSLRTIVLYSEEEPRNQPIIARNLLTAGVLSPFMWECWKPGQLRHRRMHAKTRTCGIQVPGKTGDTGCWSRSLVSM